MARADKSVCNPSRHHFDKVGQKQVPAHGAYCTGMPKEPDGEYTVNIYRCRVCGMETHEEVPYSWRPHPRPASNRGDE